MHIDLVTTFVLASVGGAVAGQSDSVTVSITKKTSSLPAGKHALSNDAVRIINIKNKISGINTGVKSAIIPSNSAALINEQNNLYTVPVTLSDGNVYTFDLDTGSSDLWVRGIECQGDDSCAGNAANYSDFSYVGFPFVDLYGSGAAAGYVFKANATIASFTSELLIGLTAIELQDTGSDGLLGLAFSSIGTLSYQVTPHVNISGNWFDALNLDNPVFGFYLSNYADGDNGEVTFGGYDAAKYSGDPAWFDLQNIISRPTPSPGYWTISINDWTWSVDATDSSPGGSGPLLDPKATYPIQYTIADTGTTLVYLPDVVFNSLALGALKATYNPDPLVEDYVIPCTNSLPNVNFYSAVANATFSIPSSIYTYVAGTDSLNNTVCIPGFQPGGDQLGIFGDVFTRAYYTFFDKKNLRLGYAPAVHSVQ
ncbi:hypothetical protein HK100_003650 [Physocladia obscura]|uniref:Peptidase A1 domain-containing protein n=1 Tax=Physocladia obscura TaxID=109957 RepID=A0AAD5X993_9FUNG|nr:hypothetical protein HK100_003650 [Physocladia obscura]